MEHLRNILFLCLIIITASLSGEIELLYPEDNSTLIHNEFSIVFSVNHKRMNALGMDQFTLLFDDHDISHDAELTDFSVSFFPDEEFRKRPDFSGEHRVTLMFYSSNDTINVGNLDEQEQAQLVSQRRLNLVSVKFSIKSVKEEESPVKLDKPDITNSGTIYSKYSYRDLSNSENSIGEMGGYGSGYNKNFFYKYNFYLTSQDDKNIQTLDRFKLTAGYTNHIILTGGNMTPRMNKFILNGKRNRGFGIRLITPSSRSGIEFVIGYIRNSVDPFIESDKRNSLSKDSTHNDSVSQFTPGTFARRLIAGRIHFGRGRVFKTGTTVAQIRDKPESIKQKYTVDTAVYPKSDTPTSTDTSYAFTIYGETPKDNLLIGQDFILHLWDHKVTLFGTGAFSLLTETTTWGKVEGMINNSETEKKYSDKFPGKKYSDYLKIFESFIVINESTSPSSTAPLAILNSTAFDGGLKLNIPTPSGQQKLEIKYEQVGSKYKSLANQYLPRNRRGLLITEELRTLSNKLFTRIAVNLYEDNLNSLKPKPTRSLVTHGLMSVYLNNNLPRFSMNASAVLHKNRSEDAGHAKDERNYSAGSNISYSHQFTRLSHTWNNNFNYSKFTSYTDNSEKIISRSISRSIALSMVSSFPDNRLKTRLGYSQSTTKSIGFQVEMFAPSIGALYYFIPQRLYLDTDLHYYLNNSKDYLNNSKDASSKSIVGVAAVNFSIKEKHSFHFKMRNYSNIDDETNKFYLNLTYEFKY